MSRVSETNDGPEAEAKRTADRKGVSCSMTIGLKGK